MKFLLFFSFVSLLVSLANAKSKYGDYYLGFGLDFVEANDVASYDGESLSLFVNSLASDEADSLLIMKLNDGPKQYGTLG